MDGLVEESKKKKAKKRWMKGSAAAWSGSFEWCGACIVSRRRWSFLIPLVPPPCCTGNAEREPIESVLTAAVV